MTAEGKTRADYNRTYYLANRESILAKRRCGWTHRGGDVLVSPEGKFILAIVVNRETLYFDPGERRVCSVDSASLVGWSVRGRNIRYIVEAYPSAFEEGIPVPDVFTP